MFKFLSVALAILPFMSAQALDFSPRVKQQETKVAVAKDPAVLNLSKNNVVALRYEIDDDSVSKAILELSLIKAEEPILYIYSPGGSVSAGMKLVEFILDYPRPITCVTDMAASMAFVIFQSCHNRVVTSSSILMQHQASFGVGGQTENVKSELGMVLSLLNVVNDAQAKRIGISRAEFDKRILSDWWLVGEDAIKAGVADKKLHLRCDEESVLGTKSMTFMTFFGPIELTFSQCPLARAPLSIDNLSSFPFEQRVEVWKTLQLDERNLGTRARKALRL